MSTGNAVFTAIRAMLIDCVNSSDYPADSIKYGYQTPLEGNFISYWLIHSHKTSVLGVEKYNSVNQIKLSMFLYENLIQVDFYSDAVFTASDNSHVFNQYLTAFAPDFLRYGYTDMSIGIVDEIRNNTEVGDKATYLPRYTARFTLYTHNKVLRPEIFMDEINIIPTLID